MRQRDPLNDLLGDLAKLIAAAIHIIASVIRWLLNRGNGDDGSHTWA